MSRVTAAWSQFTLRPTDGVEGPVTVLCQKIPNALRLSHCFSLNRSFLGTGGIGTGMVSSPDKLRGVYPVRGHTAAVQRGVQLGAV